MVDTSLKDLTPPQHTIFANGVGLSISPLKIRQLDGVMQASEPILQAFAQHQEALQDDFESTVTELVLENVAQYQHLVQVATEQPADVIANMTVDELVQAIGKLIAINPLFFSQIRKKLAAMLQANQVVSH